jgi:NAD-dependent SIR2 family protein deacetylase
MSRYASGRWAKAVCAQCCMTRPYQYLVKEPETGFMVCPECMDEPRPPIKPRIDAVALRNPQPDRFVDAPDIPESNQ